MQVSRQKTMHMVTPHSLLPKSAVLRSPAWGQAGRGTISTGSAQGPFLLAGRVLEVDPAV